MDEVKYITEHQIIFLNMHKIRLYSAKEQQGVKEEGLLSSAVNWPKQSAFGEEAYPSIEEKAAALFESLLKNHCFYNANIRTAFASLYMFLRQNGYRLVVNPKEAEDFWVKIVDPDQPEVSFSQIVTWIGEHINPIF
ncbi:type II toxin-antitoxin system death-on-curing family toxin [Bacillus sp. T33-2]|uniref:type II toxin-antitoxin system death-on-curing family toxin n=1 Tax=Bacillus sp. T33-2 TaxID=2054168 RepID=UPI000C768944|nr:type II toxin-antitoxin system death-on-curing family toxin [Bacillus sp. T33-2]PLR95766.1 type II toxin-antitoxin system death-on-curing family toxin [Bacillus sp. T33-2]